MNEKMNNSPNRYDNTPSSPKGRVQAVLAGIASVALLALAIFSFIFGFFPLMLVLCIAGLVIALVGIVASRKQKRYVEIHLDQQGDWGPFNMKDAVDVTYEPCDDND